MHHFKGSGVGQKMEKDHWHLIILKHTYIFVNQIFFTGTGTYGIYRFKDEGKELFQKKPGLIESKKNIIKTSILRPGLIPD